MQFPTTRRREAERLTAEVQRLTDQLTRAVTERNAALDQNARLAERSAGLEKQIIVFADNLVSALARQERDRYARDEELESTQRMLWLLLGTMLNRDTTEAAVPEDPQAADTIRLAAILRLVAGRPGYHTVTVKQILTAGIADAGDDTTEAAVPEAAGQVPA